MKKFEFNDDEIDMIIKGINTNLEVINSIKERLDAAPFNIPNREKIDKQVNDGLILNTDLLNKLKG